MELESDDDGARVGARAATGSTPGLQPGRSFRARSTPPRAGFMYHMHLNDEAQLPAGLYGPLIVPKWGHPSILRTTASSCSAEAAPVPSRGRCFRMAARRRQLCTGKSASGTVCDSLILSPSMVVFYYGAWKEMSSGARLRRMELISHRSKRRCRSSRRSIPPGEIYADLNTQPTVAGSLQLEVSNGNPLNIGLRSKLEVQ